MNPLPTAALAIQRTRFAADPAVQVLTHGESKLTRTFPAPDFAAYTLIASLLLNLDEAVTRNRALVRPLISPDFFRPRKMNRPTRSQNLRALLVGASLFLAVTPAGLLAQVPATGPAADRAAINLRDFDFVVEKISANYAGWDTKVTTATRPELDALTARLRAKAAAAGDNEFAALIREWLHFFRDGHVQFGAEAPANTAGPAATSASVYPALDWSEAHVRATLTALAQDRDEVEGIWSIGDDRYRVGVLRSGNTGPARNHFSAVVLSTKAKNWQPGQIKAEITRAADGTLAMLYRPGDHTETPVTASVIAAGTALMVPHFGVWTRSLPEVSDPDLLARQFPADRLFFKRVSPQTVWLRIPDFNDDRAKPLKELLAQHQAEIDSTPNLIIDLRENGGGSDFVYEPILPLLYTRPIYSIGIELRASPDNMTLRLEMAERLKADAPEASAGLAAQAKKMAPHFGGYFQPDEKPFSVTKFPKILPFPQRVAVLIDNASSTGEQFLLDARQSSKVTLFGRRNSHGVLDFANVVSMKLPSGRYGVAWATSRSLRLPDDPVDPDGIAPDVRIPESEIDPVLFAAKWLEKQRN